MLTTVVDACPMCDAPEAREFARFPELVFARCAACQTVYRSQEDLDALKFAYDDAYFTGNGSHGHGYDQRFERRVAKARGNILDALELATVAPGTVVDVGCSMGYVLEAARRLGLDAIGVDMSPFAVETCRERGYDAREGGLETTGLPNACATVVTLKHILEHTPTPRAALQEVARILAPGGAVSIEMPAIGYWKAQRFPQTYKWFRPDSIGAEHYVYPRFDQLRSLLEATGFDAVSKGVGWRRQAIERGQCSALAEDFRVLGTRARDALLAVPGLRKTMFAIARRRAEA